MRTTNAYHIWYYKYLNVGGLYCTPQIILYLLLNMYVGMCLFCIVPKFVQIILNHL